MFCLVHGASRLAIDIFTGTDFTKSQVTHVLRVMLKDLS